MGSETILYYVTEEFITGCSNNVNIHFWRKIKLSSFVLEEEDMTVVTIMIPKLKKEWKKEWKKEKLFRAMKEAVNAYPAYSENADMIMQTEVQKMLMLPKDTLQDTSMLWYLTEKILQKKLSIPAAHSPRRTESALPKQQNLQSVVLLLGDTLFVEEQMQKFYDMIHPYLPHINRLMILYEAGSDENESMQEDGGQEQERQEEAIHEYTEEIYYEYGLVAWVQQYANSLIRRHSVRVGQSPALFLDFGRTETIPFRALQTGDIYLDIFSSEDKEALFRRKNMEISYFSPRKYLDTMVKSGYDRLVN